MINPIPVKIKSTVVWQPSKACRVLFGCIENGNAVNRLTVGDQLPRPPTRESATVGQPRSAPSACQAFAVFFGFCFFDSDLMII